MTKNKNLSILFLTLIILFSQSCKKETDDLLTIKDDLLGSWHCFDYVNVNEKWSDDPEKRSPYSILNDYGSGFDLTENEYSTHYSDSLPIDDILRGTWKVKDEKTLEFKPELGGTNGLDIFEVKVLLLEENFLWIRENGVEYKLRKLE